MATSAGKVATVLVGAANPPATALEKHWDFEEDGSTDTVENHTNDSTVKTSAATWVDPGTIRFTMLADPAATGQDVVRASKAAGSTIWVYHRPQGTGSPKIQRLFECVVTTLGRATPRDGNYTQTVTCKVLAAVVESAQ